MTIPLLKTKMIGNKLFSIHRNKITIKFLKLFNGRVSTNEVTRNLKSLFINQIVVIVVHTQFLFLS